MTNSYRPGLKKFDWLRASLQIPYSPGNSIQAPMFAESVYRVNTTNKLEVEMK